LSSDFPLILKNYLNSCNNSNLKNQLKNPYFLMDERPVNLIYFLKGIKKSAIDLGFDPVLTED